MQNQEHGQATYYAKFEHQGRIILVTPSLDQGIDEHEAAKLVESLQEALNNVPAKKTPKKFADFFSVLVWVLIVAFAVMVLAGPVSISNAGSTMIAMVGIGIVASGEVFSETARKILVVLSLILAAAPTLFGILTGG